MGENTKYDINNPYMVIFGYIFWFVCSICPVGIYSKHKRFGAQKSPVGWIVQGAEQCDGKRSSVDDPGVRFFSTSVVNNPRTNIQLTNFVLVATTAADA